MATTAIWRWELSVFKRLIPLTVAAFAVGTNTLVIAGLLPAIAQSLQVSVSAAGQLVTGFALTYAIAAPVVSALTGSMDRRTVLLGALSVFVVGNVMVAVAGTYPIALAGRLVSAIGSAVIVSLSLATATAIAPAHKRARALAVVTAGLTVATTLGVPLGTLIGGVNWRITLWAVAGLGVLAAIGIAVALPQVELPATSLRERLAPLRSPVVLGILGITALMLSSGYTVYTYIGPVTAPATGGEASRLTLVLVCYGLGSLLGNIVSGFLTDSYPPVRVLLTGQTVVTVTMAVTVLATQSMISVLLWAIIWGLAGWLNGLPQQHRLVAHAPQASAVLLGLNVAVLQLGVAIGSGLGGIILPHGVGVLAAVSAGMMALALVVTIFTTRRRRTAEAVHQPGVPALDQRS